MGGVFSKLGQLDDILSSFELKFSNIHLLYFLIRLVSFAGVVIWVLTARLTHAIELELLLLLAVFFTYSLLAYLMALRFFKGLDRIYLFLVVPDLVFVTLLIHLTGGINSPFSPAYLIVVALIGFYFGLRSGLVIAFLSSMLDIYHNWSFFLSQIHPYDGLIRISLLWVIAIFSGLMGYKLRRGQKEVTQKAQELETLLDLSKALTSTLSPERQLDELLQTCISLTSTERGFVCLYNEKLTIIRRGANRAIPSKISARAAKSCEKQLSKFMFEKRRPFLYAGLKDKFSACFKEWKVHDAICTPLKIQRELLGAIFLFNKTTGKKLDQNDLRLLVTIGNDAALTIKNGQLYEENRRLFLSTIESLASAIEAKDPYTLGHAQSVTQYAVETARKMGLSAEEIDTLQKACILHDIGKLGIKDGIWAKRGKLTKAEFDRVKSHPLIGAKILEPISGLREAAKIVLHHHESYSGRGYPTGKKKEEIPLGARILAVADSFEAMISERPYRPALSREEAIEELKLGSGQQFDPEVVKNFLEIVDSVYITRAKFHPPPPPPSP